MSSGSDDPRPAGTLRSLYLCYLPLSEPLVETQVRAYLRGLARAGHRIHLMTWEIERQPRSTRARLRAELAAEGITWHRRRYHKRPSLLATVYDVLAGILAASLLVRRHRIDLVHARVHVPAAMALAVRRITGAGVLFDIRGLMAEEYVDAGTWKRGSAAYRLTTWVQRRTLEIADGVVVLTERGRALLFGGARCTAAGAPVAVIPSCVDVEAVQAAASGAGEVRRRLGLGDDSTLVYVGKFSTWYMAEEMAAFVAAAVGIDPALRFLVVTQSDPNLILDALDGRGVDRAKVVVTRCSPAEVGAHTAAAHMAISFIRDSPSKIASSPTKVGEYLAAGRPVVVSPGVGDIDDLLRSTATGVVVTGHDAESHRAAYEALRALADDPDTAERCRRAATAAMSLAGVGIPRYLDLYHEVGGRLAARRSSQEGRRWTGTSES